MSVSIYYTAKRSRPINAEEQAQIDRLVDSFSIDDELEAYLRTGKGLNWESFTIYDPASPSAPGVIFEGATKLPDNTADATWIGLDHWLDLLAQLRRALPDATWRVHVDDHDLAWDDAAGEYVV